jgi:hypothetical protein
MESVNYESIMFYSTDSRSLLQSGAHFTQVDSGLTSNFRLGWKGFPGTDGQDYFASFSVMKKNVSHISSYFHVFN